MSPLTIFEFDKLVQGDAGEGAHQVPPKVFNWLQQQALQKEDGVDGWVKISQWRKQPAVQVNRYVGVLRAPCGFQIEVLPKIGKVMNHDQARSQLLEMLLCLPDFRHIKSGHANLKIARTPLLEIFIRHFLQAVHTLIKRGLRSHYVVQEENLPTLRGKLLVSKQIRHNIVRRDRFFTRYDEFSQNRAENRLIHSALRKVLPWCQTQENQRLARELCLVFTDVPVCVDVTHDVRQIRPDRGMAYYEASLEWACLILRWQSPMSSIGQQDAPSLLFPMDAVFEAYVRKHLPHQLLDGFKLKAQASSHFLVRHEKNNWFRLKPDLLILSQAASHMVLDTKWKLLDANNPKKKYGLSQADFYQLYAYGKHYLEGTGDMALIYPATETFNKPLPVFQFPGAQEMRLWILPFCIKQKRLYLPDQSLFPTTFFGTAVTPDDGFFVAGN